MTIPPSSIPHITPTTPILPITLRKNIDINKAICISSGIILFLRSMKKITIKQEIIPKLGINNWILVIGNWLIGSIGNLKLDIATNRTPVSISIPGYCHESFSPQYRHFPLRKRKETTGMRSRGESVFYRIRSGSDH